MIGNWVILSYKHNEFENWITPFKIMVREKAMDGIHKIMDSIIALQVIECKIYGMV